MIIGSRGVRSAEWPGAVAQGVAGGSLPVAWCSRARTSVSSAALRLPDQRAELLIGSTSRQPGEQRPSVRLADAAVERCGRTGRRPGGRPSPRPPSARPRAGPRGSRWRQTGHPDAPVGDLDLGEQRRERGLLLLALGGLGLVGARVRVSKTPCAHRSLAVMCAP
jgi:hypothetical protein